MKTIKKSTKILKKAAKSMAMILLSVMLLGSSINVFAADAVPEYEKDADGNITNIKKIVKSPYTYYDDSESLGPDKEIRIDTMTDYVPKLFAQWGPIASKVFEKSTDSAFHNDSDDSASDWRNYFGPGVSESGEKTDLSKALSTEDHYEHGEYSNDCVLTTGIQYATNMDTIVHHMTDDIAKGLGDRHNTPASVIYDKVDLKTLKDTKDKQDTKAFYKIVTSIDENGGTYGYYYNSYALVFYDFELAPIVEKGVTYANQKLTTKESGGTPSGTHKTYFENKSESNSNVTTNLTSSSTQSATNSLTSTKTYSFAETIGASAEWEDPFLNLAKFTVSFSFTASQAISTAKTESKTISDTYSNSATSSVVLPPHTAIALQQKQEKQTVNVEYDCPVALRYKTAIFSMNGFRYDDRALTDYWNHPKDFVTILGSGSAEGGYDSAENLYVRAVDEKTKYKMERAFGQVEGNHEGRVVRNVVDWSSMSDINDKIETAAKQIPMFASGASMNLTSDTTSTEMSGIMPLYPLRAVIIDAPNTALVSGESLSYKNLDYYKVGMSVGEHSYTNHIKLTALNEKNIPYHGFIPGQGHWEVVDKEGNPLGDDAPVTLEVNPISKNVEYRAVKAGTCFLKYFIDEDKYSTAYNGDEYTKNSDLNKTAALEIEVKDDRFKGDVTVNGSYEGIVGDDPKSLDDSGAFQVTVTDDTGKEVSRPYYWEAKELPTKGISIDGSNVSFTKPGTYHIRAVSGEMYSDWVEVTAVKRDVEVSFEGDFGKKQEKQTIGYNTAPTLPTSEEMNLPACKQFDGWFLDKEYTKPYEDGTKLKEDTALYANIKHLGLIKTERKEPTYFEDGNIEYFTCPICGKYFRDHEGKEEITKEETILPKLHFDGSIKIEGSYNGLVWDDPQSIEGKDRLMVSVYDKSGKEITEDYRWEQQELPYKGMTLDGNKVEFSEAGKYHVRVTIGDYYTDWVEITASNKDLVVNYFDNLSKFHETRTVEYNHVPELFTAEDLGLTDCQTLEGWYLDQDCTNAYDGSKIKTDTNLFAKITHDPLDKVEAKAATCSAKGNIEHYKCPKCEKLFEDANGIKEITKEDTEIAMIPHSWDAGKVTKYPTKKVTGIKTYTCTKCHATKTESIPKLTDKAIKIKGKAKKKKIIIGWNPVSGADGYYVYASKCSTKKCNKSAKKIATLKNGKIKKFVYKKLKKGTYYKLKIKAFKKYGNVTKVIAESMTIHLATKGAKFGNPTKIVLKKKNLKVKAGKKIQIKAKVKSKKKVYYHIAKLRYESQDTSIATVTKKGKVKGLKKGKTTIYVFTQNCLYKKVKVTVK